MYTRVLWTELWDAPAIFQPKPAILPRGDLDTPLRNLTVLFYLVLLSPIPLGS